MRVLVSLLVAVAVAACGGSELPGFARPHGSTLTDAELEDSDLISYRKLTREDFLASGPSGPAAKHAERLGAQSFVVMKHAPNINILWQELPGGDFEGRVENLSYRAFFDRKRSWWNAKRDHDYVLEHEQIHFALTEIEARKLDADARELGQQTFDADSQDALTRKIEEEVNGLLKRAAARLADRSLEFDEDTSNRVDREKQTTWRKVVEEELLTVPVRP